MQFRTIIEPLPGRCPISHDTRLVLLGSCFTTEIGERLVHDGFHTVHNPMGVLYNPASIAKVVNRALSRREYTTADLLEHDGNWLCLDFNTRYRDTDPTHLLDRLNTEITTLGEQLEQADRWIITFGTARVYEHHRLGLVGNCHKLPAGEFSHRLMTVDEITALWQPLALQHDIIFTVSPIRHTADGLHGNQVSKATLLMAVDNIAQSEYFPSYEILLDDLRDYRFYAADMKHPSEVAVDYIYKRFGETYFTQATQSLATDCRKQYKRNAHRPILQQ